MRSAAQPSEMASAQNAILFALSSQLLLLAACDAVTTAAAGSRQRVASQFVFSLPIERQRRFRNALRSLARTHEFALTAAPSTIVN